MRNRLRDVLRVVAVAVLLIAVSAAGCLRTAGTAADNAGPVVAGAPDGLGGIADDIVPPVGAPADDLGRGPAATAAEATQVVTTHAGDLSAQQRKLVVDAGCAVLDVAEVYDQETVLGSAEQALIAFGGDATLRFRAAGLAEDLAAADTFGEAAQAALVAAVCELN